MEMLRYTPRHLRHKRLVLCAQVVCTTSTWSNLDSGQCNILLHQECKLCTVPMIPLMHTSFVGNGCLACAQAANYMHLQYVPAAQGV